MMGGMDSGGDPMQAQQAYMMQMMMQNPQFSQNPQLAQMMYQQQAMQQQQQQPQQMHSQQQVSYDMQQQMQHSQQLQQQSLQQAAPPAPAAGGSQMMQGAMSKAGSLAAPNDQWQSGNSYGGSCGGNHQADYQQSAPATTDYGVPAAPGASGKTVEDDIVKILDPYGNPANIRALQSFSECPFPHSLMEEINKAGFTKPSQIQANSWPISLQGQDVIGVAATGSGKTLAFLFPAFMHILNNRCSGRDPVLLVLAPTRELAVQIEKEAQKFGGNSNIKTVCCYGGAPKGDQLRLVRAGCHCLIATPGRLNDFLEGRQIRLDGICKLVLDEADRMLDMGFEPQIRKILREVPTRRHTLFFTATWPKEVRKLAEDFLHNPYQVQIGNRDELKGNQDITQFVKIVQQYDKNSQLLRVLQEYHLAGHNITQGAKGLVFSATKRGCDGLEHQLRRAGVASSAIHGDKDQRQRDEALDNFRAGRVQVLVATDVAARGLDIKGVTLVVNFDPANNAEDYVHRIGRTGRAGQKGTAVTFLTNSEGTKAKGIIEVMEKTSQHIGDDLRQLAASVPDKGAGKGRYRAPTGEKAGAGDRDRSRSRGPRGGGKGGGKGGGDGDHGHHRGSFGGGGDHHSHSHRGGGDHHGHRGSAGGGDHHRRSRSHRRRSRSRRRRSRSRSAGGDNHRRKRRSASRRRSQSQNRRRSPSRSKSRGRRKNDDGGGAHRHTNGSTEAAGEKNNHAAAGGDAAQQAAYAGYGGYPPSAMGTAPAGYSPAQGYPPAMNYPGMGQAYPGYGQAAPPPPAS